MKNIAIARTGQFHNPQTLPAFSEFETGNKHKKKKAREENKTEKNSKSTYK